MLNEPESSLDPDLLLALGRPIAAIQEQCCQSMTLEKLLGGSWAAR